MTQLRKGQLCPIHHSFYCCGRQQRERKPPRKSEFVGPGIRRVADSAHPRGYREICSPAELTRRKHRLMASGKLICIYCGGNLRECEYSDVALCHLEPKGMNGARRDDHIGNLALGHHVCNLENGSRRPAA
jgi:hypothetical protein